MTHSTTSTLPLIAIIRGVLPSEVLDVAQVLVDAGFNMIEVPLNSPDALTSIKMLVDKYGPDFSDSGFAIGAGTVTSVELAQQVIDTGANLVVTPNCVPEVISMCRDAGCLVYPGIVTPTEAFSALAAGASGLKLFPISMVGVDGMKALISVLPKGTELYPVGGINPTKESMLPYLQSGAVGFGLGSALYKSGMALDQVKENAEAFAMAYNACLSD